MILRQLGTADSSQFRSLRRCGGINVPDATRYRGFILLRAARHCGCPDHCLLGVTPLEGKLRSQQSCARAVGVQVSRHTGARLPVEAEVAL